MTKRALLTTAGVFAVVILTGMTVMSIVRDGDDSPSDTTGRTATGVDERGSGSGTGTDGGSSAPDGGEGHPHRRRLAGGRGHHRWPNPARTVNHDVVTDTGRHRTPGGSPNGNR